MYSNLLDIHSALRYVVFALLVVVILKSLMGWLGKKPFTGLDNKLALFLLISAHIQLLIGLFLYSQSPFVQFDNMTMKVKMIRYWSVEHISMMIVAIILITVAKSSLKRLTTDESKHKRLFILNTLALVIILVAIKMSGRGLFNF